MTRVPGGEFGMGPERFYPAEGPVQRGGIGAFSMGHVIFRCVVCDG